MVARMTDAIDYAEPGPLTDLGKVSPPALERIPGVAIDIRPAPQP
jgi:hypothetical protein